MDRSIVLSYNFMQGAWRSAISAPPFSSIRIESPGRVVSSTTEEPKVTPARRTGWGRLRSSTASSPRMRQSPTLTPTLRPTLGTIDTGEREVEFEMNPNQPENAAHAPLARGLSGLRVGVQGGSVAFGRKSQFNSRGDRRRKDYPLTILSGIRTARVDRQPGRWRACEPGCNVSAASLFLSTHSTIRL
jgi:hypothetical protein